MTANTEHPVRTPKEIDTLKRVWLRDPCWDIEDTEGFEAYRAEMLAFRLEREKVWAQEAIQRRQAQIDGVKAKYDGISDRTAIDIFLAESNLKNDKDRAHNILSHLFSIASEGREVDASDLWSLLEYITAAAVAQATIDILARGE